MDKEYEGLVELAVNSDFCPVTHSLESMELQISRLKNAGISHVHWCYDWDGEYMLSQWEIIQIAELLGKYGMKVKAIHGAEGTSRGKVVDGVNRFINRTRLPEKRKDITNPCEYNRQAGVELVKNRIDLAAAIGAKEVVLHLVIPYEDFNNIPGAKEKWYEQVFKSFDQIEPYCRAKRIRIAIENMICTPIQYQIEKLEKLFERYDLDYMGFCCDTGHSNLMSPGDKKTDEFTDYRILINKFKHRLIALHINDNKGIDWSLSPDHDGAIAKSDRHMIPYRGNLDWDYICREIADSPYELPLTLEVAVPRVIREKATPEEIRDGLAEIRTVGTKLTDLVLQYRQTMPNQ